MDVCRMDSLQTGCFNLEHEQAKFEVVSKIRKSLDLEEILQTTIQEIRQLLNVDRVGVLRLNPQQGWDEGEFVAETVLPRFDSALAVRVRDHCFGKRYAEAYQNGRVHAIEDIYTAGLSDCHIEILRQFQVRANLLVPLIQGKQLWGLLCIHQCSGPRQWTLNEIDFASKIAAHLGVAIQHAELLSQTQKQTLELNQALQELKSAHVQLAHAEKMSSLGQLAAGVAHEVNNPVNFIQGNLQHVDSYVKDLITLVNLYRDHCHSCTPAIQAALKKLDIQFLLEDLPDVLHSMAAGATRIETIVEGLRNFSQLGGVGLKTVDLHQGIESSLLLLKNRLRATEQRPEIRVCKTYGQVPRVECYPEQINQVLISILTNAIDAFDGAWVDFLSARTTCGPILSIKTETSANAVLIVIGDNGPGMTPKVKAKLYDPFFTTKPVGQGTGLGLAISHQIIVRHRGRLQCFSQPGQGTEFSIQLPIQQTVTPTLDE